jgi:hypothetical protein
MTNTLPLSDLRTLIVRRVGRRRKPRWCRWCQQVGGSKEVRDHEPHCPERPVSEWRHAPKLQHIEDWQSRRLAYLIETGRMTLAIEEGLLIPESLEPKGAAQW